MATTFSHYARRWALGFVLAALVPLSSVAAVIKVGSIPGVTSDAVQALIPEAKKQGLDIELVEFTDWTLPNEAVNNRDIDVNFFQHEAFLRNAIKERGYGLQLIGLGLLQNIGLYSNKYRSLDQVPKGATVSVPNDPVNQGRGLLLLQKAGLITLRNGLDTGATVNDVVGNPKQLKLVEIEGPQLIHSLPDVDLAVVWPSYFVSAGRKADAGKALVYSGIADTFYAMGFAVRKDRAGDPVLQQFVQLFQQSKAVRDIIDERFDHNPNLYTLPWQGKQRSE
ncbi:MetQ/NlpA family ABC transporter substrate-binding protein [Alcaligenes sp. SDU_A2]|uniref:MetQ/NlpA family ABC transporter substrate-binding protein n=1 Tax=Alcaligenes sp. SDU_A2 TaxID=3136634 RepID=UPI002BAB2C72|nr:MetQ/NlpA family ABC transporter substrate-binding protein [Alcaligenes sp.]HRL26464.1 MetQ/NlpA family ABC transporter substrate-binding protein [Alcaligenes sp.]